MPKFKVKGQMVQSGEHPQTNGQMDATRRIIAPATRSIKIVVLANLGFSGLGLCGFGVGVNGIKSCTCPCSESDWSWPRNVCLSSN